LRIEAKPLGKLDVEVAGNLLFGHFGDVSVAGRLTGQPRPSYAFKGDFCLALIPPFVFSGSLALCAGFVPENERSFCEYDNSVAFEARAKAGYLGEWHIKGQAAFSPFVVRGSAEIKNTFNEIVGDIIDFIVRTIAGTSNPEKSLAAIALKTIFSLHYPITGARVRMDTSVDLMDLTIYLNILGNTVPMIFPMPVPITIRRRHLDALQQGLSVKTLGEILDASNWPHPSDKRENATRRRAEEGSCGVIPDHPVTPNDVLDSFRATFHEFGAMVSSIAPIDFSLEHSTGWDLIDQGFSGRLRFQLLRSGHMQFDMTVSMTFLGVAVSGEVELAVDGGVRYARLTGTGSTPALCNTCPELYGFLTIARERSDFVLGGPLTISMAVSFSIACFEVSGTARFSGIGGLTDLAVRAVNPSCFLDPLRRAFETIVPGAGFLLGSIGILDAEFVWDLWDDAITLRLEINFSGDPQDSSVLVVVLPVFIRDAGDLVDGIINAADSVLELVDDWINIFSLTFLDITLSDSKYASSNIGERSMFHSGRGVAVSSQFALSNSGYARVGLFGSAFGVDVYQNFRVDTYFIRSNVLLVR